jgi:hypothetical protein
MKLSSSSRTKKALLLGCVFGTETIPKVGQGYWDRVRCKALEEADYVAHTLDNKHEPHEAKLGKLSHKCVVFIAVHTVVIGKESAQGEGILVSEEQ